jgi:hypothetical protein
MKRLVSFLTTFFKAQCRSPWLLLSLVVIFALYFFLYPPSKRHFLEHEPYDSYTLQAVRWWQGYNYLKEDVSFLELAIYKGHYYVSFPPFPSVIMALFTPFLGENTPSNLINTAYAVISYLFLVRLFTLRLMSSIPSILWAFFLVFGSNILWMSLHGGVWFQAQCLSFCLSCGAICLLHEKSRKAWGVGLAMLACAVLCRPLQVVFFPVLLVLLVRNLSNLSTNLSIGEQKPTLREIAPFLIAPVVIAIIAGIYNYVRFDNPLEFGHHHLPGFKHSQYGLFHWKYLAIHAVEVTRLPEYKDGRVIFQTIEGFAFWLANPFYVVFLFQFLRRSFWKNTQKSLQAALLLGVFANLFLTLCHDTMGVWQFGLRYFADALPFIGLSTVLTRQKIHPIEVIWMTLAVALQFYGAIYLAPP